MIYDGGSFHDFFELDFEIDFFFETQMKEVPIN